MLGNYRKFPDPPPFAWKDWIPVLGNTVKRFLGYDIFLFILTFLVSLNDNPSWLVYWGFVFLDPLYLPPPPTFVCFFSSCSGGGGLFLPCPLFQKKTGCFFPPIFLGGFQLLFFFKQISSFSIFSSPSRSVFLWFELR